MLLQLSIGGDIGFWVNLLHFAQVAAICACYIGCIDNAWIACEAMDI